MKPKFNPFTLRSSFIEFPQSIHTLARIKEVHQLSQLTKKGKGIAVLGPSGAGKTTVLEEYIRTYMAKVTAIGVKPIILVQVPSNPTPKSLSAATLTAMGDQFSDRASADDNLSRIVTLMEGLRTEMIIFDEAQHLVERRKSPTGATTDWLKNLINQAKIAVVLSGLKRTEDLLISNEQLRRRFSATVYYDRFKVSDENSAELFATLLLSLQELLPVPGLSFISQEALPRLYHASFGIIDYLINIIDRAVWHVQNGKHKEIDLLVLAQSFRDEVWSLAPNTRNPFCKEYSFSELIGKNEPFEDFDIKAS